MLCYKLDELAEGRATVWGLQSDLKPGTAAKKIGDSLATVILSNSQWHAERLEKELAGPYRGGEGSVDEGEVEQAREDVKAAEELIRRTAERRRPKLVR